MQFFDTTRKGSWHSSMFDELPGGTYQLHSHGPIEDPFKKAPSTTRTTFNPMRASVSGDKELECVKCQFDKMNRPNPKNWDMPKPSGEPRKKPKLNVNISGIPHRRPQKWAMKCPVCSPSVSIGKRPEHSCQTAASKI